jgi:CBS domain containing-hemolysin-like protein
VFGELAPKSIAIQQPIGVTMFIALPLHFFYLIFRPFIFLLNGFANGLLKLMGIQAVGSHESAHTSEELQYLLEQGKESGALNLNEHELIKNVFDFNERVVKHIMVPRTKISGIEQNTPPQEFLETIVKEGYSRMPIYDETIDKIIGG